MFKKILALLMLSPAAALAADMQYVVYNSFSESVDAFQRVALIASDPVYLILAGCFGAASIVFAGMAEGMKGLSQQGGSPVGLMLQAFLGLMVFFGLVIPKGTVFIYDAALNKTQAVGDVPEIIVLIAGGLNAAEREMIRVSDTASANPYGEDANAINYSLVYSATRSSQPDLDLERSIGQYVMDCGLMAMSTGSNGASLNELARTSEDLYTTLAEYTHPAWPTVYYPAGNSGGVGGTCQDAWGYIKPRLDDFTASGPIDPMMRTACRDAGFDPSDASQYAICQSKISQLNELFGVDPVSAPVLMRNFVIAAGLQKMLMHPDFEQAQGVLVNRRVMAESFGVSQSMDKWMPRIRGFMLSLVLGIVPLALLFVVTSAVWKAVALVAGLFVWMALWGVADAVSVQMVRDAATDAFAVIKSQKLSFESIMNTPPAAVQALGIYGKARSMSLIIATVISSALFKFGSYAFTGLAQNMSADLERAGADAGRKTMLPEETGNAMQSLQGSINTMSQVSSVGAETAMSASARPGQVGAAAQAMRVDPTLSGGMLPSYNEQVFQSAAGTVGSEGAAIRTNQALGAARGTGALETNIDVGTAQGSYSGATALGRSDAAGATGRDVVGVGMQSGTAEVARSNTDRKLSELLSGDGKGEGIFAQGLLARQNQLQTEASVKAAAPFGGQEYDYSARQRQEELQQGRFNQVGDLAHRAGIAEGTNTRISTLGQESAIRALGSESLYTAGEFSAVSNAATGASAAAVGGGAVQAGITTGRQSGIERVARAEKRQEAAEAIFGPGNHGLMKFEESANGNMTLALTGNDYHRFLDQQASRGMPEEMVQKLRRESGGVVSFGYGDDGQMANMSIHAAKTGETGAFYSRRDGSREELRHDTVVSNSNENVSGSSYHGLGFFHDQNAQTAGLLKMYDGNIIKGSKNAEEETALVDGIAGGFVAKGLRTSSSNQDQSSDQGRLGLSANAGVGTGAGPGVNLGVGADGSYSHSWSDTDSSEVSLDVYKPLIRDAIAESRATAMDELRAQNPGQPFLNTDDPLVNTAVAQRSSELLQERLAQIEESSRKEIPTKGNDVVENEKGRADEGKSFIDKLFN